MAIQNINLGTAPNGVGGDTLRSTAVKINENFSNATHAAGRLLGAASGQIPLAQDAFKATFSHLDGFEYKVDCDLYEAGTAYMASSSTLNIPDSSFNPSTSSGAWVVYTMTQHPVTTSERKLQLAFGYSFTGAAYRVQSSLGWSKWVSLNSDVYGLGGNARLLSGNKVKRLDIETGFYQVQSPTDVPIVMGYKWIVNFIKTGSDSATVTISTNDTRQKRTFFAQCGGGVWSDWIEQYTTANTTKDANGFIKAASPIVKVHADKVVLNDEAVQQNVTFKKNGIGDYTITTESGLSTDGWYIELPKDLNGNPKVAVTLSEVEGVITLKSYKRIFSMETFTFEPDLDTPLDIPTDRWIDIRLNEIPVDYTEIPVDDTELDKEPTEPYSEV